MISNPVQWLVAVGVVAFAVTNASAAIIYESGTLGTSGIPIVDVDSQIVLAANVTQNSFQGVRFHLDHPVVTSQVGGHFVGLSSSNHTFFGAIVKLEDESDFPNSANLSTPDVLAATLLTFPEPSDEVFGGLSLQLSPGWYALVFGSGLFGASGTGGLLLNNQDIDLPSYLGHQLGSGWGNRQSIDNKRLVIKGVIVPEPSACLLLWFGCALTYFFRYQFGRVREAIAKRTFC